MQEADEIQTAPSLGDLILRMLTKDKNITDVHCSSGEILRTRKASNDWVIPVDEKNAPYMISHEQIVALINGIYEGEETPYLLKTDGEGNTIMSGPQGTPERRKPKWIDQLYQKKSLHPSMNLVDESVVEGVKTQMIQRVRFTIQRQGMGSSIGLMARGLREVPKSIQDLGLPLTVNRMVEILTSGLVIVTGPTGAGKSTTIAALLSKFNKERRANVVTLEDPVEFQYESEQCFFTQREIGVDVDSFEAGVVDAMRFALDILVIGEIRTAETMRAALRAAESGHLVLATTHSPSATAAVRKMLAYLDNESDAVALSNCLMGVIAQALIPDIQESQNKKHLAFEVLPCSTKEVQELIATGDGAAMSKLEENLRGEKILHSTPFRQSLAKHVKENRIEARRAAAVVQHAEDRATLLSMGREGGAPGATGLRGATALRARA
jgi:Tfp pilus assembly pilus retraction ATPase PilT